MLQNICEKLLFSFAEFQQRISSLPTEKSLTHAAQNMKFCVKDFFSKCEKILSFLRIWSNSPYKSLMENFIFEQWDEFLLQLEFWHNTVLVDIMLVRYSQIWHRSFLCYI